MSYSRARQTVPHTHWINRNHHMSLEPMDSQLPPYLHNGRRLQPAHTTQPIVPQICRPSAAAARENMPQQQRQQLLSQDGTEVGWEFPHIYPLSLSIHRVRPFIHSFSPPENTSQMCACACVRPGRRARICRRRSCAAATQPSSPGRTRSFPTSHRAGCERHRTFP